MSVIALAGCTKIDDNKKLFLPSCIAANNSNNSHEKRLLEKETPYTLFYQNSDSSYSLYIFSSPVSYYNTQDELEMIDNSIVQMKDKKIKKSGYLYENKSNDVKLYFPENVTKNPILIEKKNSKWGLYLLSENYAQQAQKVNFVDYTKVKHDAVAYDKKDEELDVRIT